MQNRPVTLTASNSVIIRTVVSIIPHKLRHNAPGYQLNATNLFYQFYFRIWRPIVFSNKAMVEFLQPAALLHKSGGNKQKMER